MRSSPPDDPVLRMLRRLPAASPDPAHDDRVRTRCQAALAEGRRRPAYRWTAISSRPLESAMVGAFALMYFVAILYDVSRVYAP